jgi:hypothetical protein
MNLNITVFDGISTQDVFGTGNQFLVYDNAWVNGALFDYIIVQENFNALIETFIAVNDGVHISESIITDLQSQISVHDFIHASEHIGMMLLSYISSFENISVSENFENIIISGEAIPVLIDVSPRVRVFNSSSKNRVFDVNPRYRIFTAKIQKTIENK